VAHDGEVEFANIRMSIVWKWGEVERDGGSWNGGCEVAVPVLVSEFVGLNTFGPGFHPEQ
jgi:hypothetical protein